MLIEVGSEPGRPYIEPAPFAASWVYVYDGAVEELWVLLAATETPSHATLECSHFVYDLFL